MRDQPFILLRFLNKNELSGFYPMNFVITYLI